MKEINFNVEDIEKIDLSMDVGIREIYPPLENLEVVPTKQKQIFKHENSYGYDNVTINPISDEYIIPSGTLPITENTTYDVREYAKVSASVHPIPNLQDKEVTPTKEIQNITSDENYDGLNQVIVNPIPDEYIAPNGELEITENGTYDVKEYASANINIPTGGGGVTPEVGFVVDEWNTSGYATKVSVYGLTTLPSYSFGTSASTMGSLITQKLVTLNLPDELHTFNDNCCKYATKLNMSQLPQSTKYIGTSSFQYCDNSNLNIIDFSNISSNKIIKSYAFDNNKLTNLKIINQSNVVLELNSYAFATNSNLTELVLDGYIALNQASNCFRNNTSLKKATIKPFRTAYILADNFFNGCSVLDTLIIETDSLVMPQPGSSTFTNTPIANGTGSIYVTDSMVESYKAKWTNYATLIKPLSELTE